MLNYTHTTKYTLGVFPALAFAADFPPVAPEFRGGRNANASEIWAQLTKNLFRKIKYKKIPRVHLSQNQAQKDSGRT